MKDINEINLPPRSNGDLKARQVILFTPEQDKALRDYCKARNTTVSGLMRCIVDQLLNDELAEYKVNG